MTTVLESKTTQTQAPLGRSAPLYDNKFFDGLEASAVNSARAIVPLVLNLVPCGTVVDIGCGRGAWLSVFQEHGAEKILGYDGHYVDRKQLLIPESCFRAADLEAAVDVEESFDLAVCLEVGEHLPRRCSMGLVRTLCKAAPAILFSAAIPGQGGTHHINEQWPEFWAELFATNGYERLDPIRREVFADRRVAPWYKQNTFLFVHRELMSCRPDLQLEHELALRQNVQVIAADRLIPLRSVQGLAGELVRAVFRSIRRRLGR